MEKSNCTDLPRRFSLRFLLIAVSLASLVLPFAIFAASNLLHFGCPVSKSVVYDTFLLATLGFLLVVVAVRPLIWRAVLLWSWLGFLLGLLGCFVPFGAEAQTIASNPNSFYGFGVPFPIVMWEDGRDYPGPLALALNPITYAVCGILVILSWHALKSCFRCLTRVVYSPAPPPSPPPAPNEESK